MASREELLDLAARAFGPAARAGELPGLLSSRREEALTCVDCGVPLERGRRYRCPPCVEADRRAVRRPASGR